MQKIEVENLYKLARNTFLNSVSIVHSTRRRHFDWNVNLIHNINPTHLNSFWQFSVNKSQLESGTSHCAIVTVLLLGHIVNIRTDNLLSGLHLSDFIWIKGAAIRPQLGSNFYIWDSFL